MALLPPIPERPADLSGQKAVSHPARPRQYIGFVIDYHQIERALDIPRDHRIVKITLAGDHEIPSIRVILEGPAGLLTERGAMVYYDNLDRWRASVDEMREAAMKQFGPYEW